MPNALMEPETKKVLPIYALVLVVDDEEQNRALLRDPLEARGFEVIEAENGREALRLISERPPDVILLDLMMPGMDGFEVCRRIKQDERTAAIPLLVVTALSERKERLMGIEAGANDFLSKPVDIVDLLLRVTNAAHTKALYDQLRAEREKSDQLLLNILPEPIARRMKDGELSIADRYSDVSVLLADLAGFTTMASHIPPQEIVFLLNEIFTSFDLLLGKHRVEKIKTIGDAYMAAAGVPVPTTDHARSIVELALDMRRELERFNREYETSFQIRIGISSGPVVAGVIGKNKFNYDLWGDTVNLACRLEALGAPGGILIDEATSLLIADAYRLGPEQKLEIKGRGKTLAYPLLEAL